jgi:hypothetical protein
MNTPRGPNVMLWLSNQVVLRHTVIITLNELNNYILIHTKNPKYETADYINFRV